jgi:glucosylceramidase
MITTRRDFLTAGMGALAVRTSRPLRAATRLSDFYAAGIPDDAIQVWITDDDRRLSPAPPLLWTQTRRTISENGITIRREDKFQPILGFGAAFTDGSCYLFNQLAPAARDQLFHRLFHPSEMGLNVCRTCIGSSDHSVSLYSFDDGGPDPELKRFSIEHDHAYILPVIRQALNVNPALFLFSSPWSPPGWMKDNGSMLGGCMRHTYMESYANYFVKFVQAYAAAGVPIQAITVQNEVDADQQGLMPACFWPQDYESAFVRDHLGPTFRRAGMTTKIWIIDHNYNLWGRAIAELETPGVTEYTNAVAWHGYSGQPEWMMRVLNAFPNLEMHWTEGSPDHDDPEYLKCWAQWAQKFSDILHNGCRSITGWCFVTDERGRPNIGPYPLGGMLTIDSATKDIYHGGQFWAMEHYSRFIRRGAARIESQSSSKDLAHCAFENPDGSLVLVITNPVGQRVCELELKSKSTKLQLSPNSVTTLVWSGAA